MKKSYSILVYGKVQGVGFRHAARRQALLEGVGGWVMNRSDGSVAIFISGGCSENERFIRWCRRGPAWASVHRVDVAEVGFTESDTFEIRYE